MHENGVNDHERLLRDAVAAFCTRDTSLKRVRSWRGREPGFDRELWRKMAGLGWFGIALPERYGGAGLGFAEMAIVAEEVGAALLPEPVVAAAVLAARAILLGDSEALKQELLPGIIAGALVPALAWQEADGGIDPLSTQATARAVNGGFVLNASKRFVFPAAGADGFVVSAAVFAGIALFWIPRQADGVRLELERRADGSSGG